VQPPPLPAAAVQPPPLPTATVPERIGLDDIFEMSNSELREMSPNNTFTKLRARRKDDDSEQSDH
jgi:hypothetical protein